MAAKSSEWRPGPTVCRCCLTEGCYKDISTEYFWMGKREVYAEMLKDTLDVSIAYSKAGGPNSNSRLICEPCISRLRDATEFKRQVVECERMFMQHLDPGSSSLNVDLDSEPLDKIKIEGVKLEKGNSDDDFDDRQDFGLDDDDDDDDDDLDNQPLTKLASKVPKKESVDLLDLLDNSKAAEKRKATTKAKAPPPKKAKAKVEPPKPKPTSSKPKPEKKKKGSDKDEPTPRIVPLFQVSYDRTLSKPLGTVDYNTLRKMRQSKMESMNLSYTPSRSPSPISLPKRDTKSPIDTNVFDTIPLVSAVTVKPKAPKTPATDIRQNVLTIFEFSTVYPFVYGNNKFKCFICSQPFLETSVLRQHMKDNHTFASLKRLVNNRRENILKADVSEMECKICSTRPQSLAELKDHLKEHGKPIDPDLKDNIIPFKIDGGGSYQCVICEQVFIKVRILVIHMSVHFNNYSCEICGSGFMTLRLLKKHLEVHESGHYPCDRCDKVFVTPYKRTLHIRGVHMKQYPRRCPMCPERFNSNYKRTIHLQDVHNQSTRVHKCETCGRAFNLKYHLICHIRSVHLQERNQQCDVCHVRFCNKETLKRHMVIHTGEKNHKCDVCGAAFLRRKNLKDHLRLHDIGS